MSKKSKTRKSTASGSSRVLAVLGIIVILSFVISLLAPDFKVSRTPTPTLAFIIPSVSTVTPTASPMPVLTTAAPSLPTPGQAVAPTP